MRVPLERVSIFIASPGDVAEARNRTRRSVDRVNRLVAKHSGILFEAVGWEDIRPGRAGRAQDVINPYVDGAHIFIGILHQRFGTPTGVAESGTQEEFERMVARWEHENPKPEVWVWFKRPSPERLANPDEQFERVLRFKEGIRYTMLYQEFEDEVQFQDALEAGLADWVHERAAQRPVLAGPRVHELSSTDLGVLLSLLGLEHLDGAPAEPVPTAGERNAALQSLQAVGVIGDIEHPAVQPDLETFLFVSSRLLSSSRALQYVTSRYYAASAQRFLTDIVQQRHHTPLDAEGTQELGLFMRLSPTAASIVMFGDTTRYDNLFAHVGHNERLRDVRQKMAQELLAEEAFIGVARDVQQGRTITHFEGRQLAVKVLSLKIAAAFHDRIAFSLDHRFPVVGVRAGTDFQEGQMAFGPAELHAHTGLAFIQLEEYELALISFDHALGGQLRDDVRAATLNNRGLAHLRLKQWQASVADFEAALALNPDLEQVRANLAEAQQHT